jgi:hypothetical protein
MPRQMPRFDNVLAAQLRLAEGIVSAGETMRRDGGVMGQKEWTIARLEALHELAFLRVFLCWESCLESVFYRSLCGFSSKVGQEVLLSGSHFRTLASAEASVLNGRRYLLWHNPGDVVKRCKKYICSGTGYHAVQETILSSHQTRLELIGAIRHRIAHHQTDARNQFDTATLAFAARTYANSQPGRFLRDREIVPPYRRWMTILSSELISLLSQMV